MNPLSTIHLIFGGIVMGCLLPAAGVWGKWVEQREISGLIFFSEISLREISSLVNDLHELRKDIESTLEIRCEDHPITIFLFRTRYNYLSYMRVHEPEGAQRQAYFVPDGPNGRVYAWWSRSLDTDLRHELTHAYLHLALPYLPIWLDEGLAEYFELPPRRRPDYHPQYLSVRWTGRFRDWQVRLAELEQVRHIQHFQAAEYRDAWALVHFMLHGPMSAREALIEYLQTIPTGKEPVPLSLSLSRKVPELTTRVQQHFR